MEKQAGTCRLQRGFHNIDSEDQYAKPAHGKQSAGENPPTFYLSVKYPLTISRYASSRRKACLPFHLMNKHCFSSASSTSNAAKKAYSYLFRKKKCAPSPSLPHTNKIIENKYALCPGTDRYRLADMRHQSRCQAAAA